MSELEPKQQTWHWLPVRTGRLRIGPRPGKGRFGGLQASGVEVVVTLLSAKEGAGEVAGFAAQAGLGWLHCPLPNGQVPPAMSDDRFAQHIRAMEDTLRHRAKITCAFWPRCAPPARSATRSNTPSIASGCAT